VAAACGAVPSGAPGDGVCAFDVAGAGAGVARRPKRPMAEIVCGGRVTSCCGVAGYCWALVPRTWIPEVACC